MNPLSMKRCSRAACFLLLFAAPYGFSQSSQNLYVTDENSTGVMPVGVYSGVRENINLNNLNLNIVIPLFTLKGRDGFDFTVAAAYNAIQREWLEREDQYGNTRWRLERVAGGGGSSFAIELAPKLTHVSGAYAVGATAWWQNRYILREPDGTRHELVNKDTGGDVEDDTYQSLERFRSNDSTHMEFRETQNATAGTLYLKNGTQISFSGGAGTLAATSMRDTNGNVITFNSADGSVTDSLGRQVRISYPAANVTEVRVADANGVDRLYRLTDTDLELPNGLRYTFEWADIGPLKNPKGETSIHYDRRLVKITYPTGGYTRYTWSVPWDKTFLTAKYVNAGDGEAAWTYVADRYATASVATTRETRPDGSYSIHSFTEFASIASRLETRIEYYGPTGALLRTAVKDWNTFRKDARVERETTILETNLQRKIEYSYDATGYSGGTNGNITEVREYGYGSGLPGPMMRRTSRSYLNVIPYDLNGFHILDRLTREIVFNGAGVQAARTDYSYDGYTAPRTLVDTPGAAQHDAAYGTAYRTRGNVTQISKWLNTTGSFLYTLFRYDICGNVREQTDSVGHTTKTFYNSAYQYAYPDRIEDPLGFASSRSYDFSDTHKRGFGYLTAATDPNGKTTTFSHDVHGRVRQVTYPDGGLVEKFYSDTDLNALHRGSYVFPDRTSTQPRVKVFTKMQETPYLEKVVLTAFDLLGRASMSAMSSAGGNFDWTRTEYDGNGRTRRMSNPITLAGTIEIPLSTSFTLWTTTEYDALDRVTKVTTPDGAIATTRYTGNQTTITDEAGKRRRSVTDGLGRMTEVIEDPDQIDYRSTYQYDALGNLTTVHQGIQTRSFAYDSLGRLTSATHPENDTVTYQYDANGNVTQKSDSRGTITYSYDALNRVISKNYTDGTPPVSFEYDAATVSNSRGHLTKVSSTVTTCGYDEYDALGRVKRSSQVTDGNQYLLTYAYNLAGGMTAQTYPSGRTVTNVYDIAGRVSSVSGTKTGEPNKTYASSISYAPHGAVKAMRLGNSLWEHTNFNNRLQPLEIGLGISSTSTSVLGLSYFYGGTNNNGNVLSQTITAPGITLSQSYTYDALNRLWTFDEVGGWSQIYNYDRYGNRWVAGNVPNPTLTPQSELAFNAANNRLAGSEYDESGNLTRDAAGNTFTYDLENHQKTFNGTTATYAYDGEGRRVRKVQAGGTTIFVYNALGQLVAEYSDLQPSGTSVTSYLTADHLGSTRIITDAAGAPKKCYDYLPFGEEIPASVGGRSSVLCYSATDAVRQRFTGKERDTESGLDSFGARYFSGVHGRFRSVDPAGHGSRRVVNPQKWNRYTYALNNPLQYVDPDGREEYSFTRIGEFSNHLSGVLTTKLGVGIGFEKARALVGVSGKAGAAAKLNLHVPNLKPYSTSVTVSAEAGGKAAIEGIQAKAQLATEATLVKNGAFEPSGFQNKSETSVTIPETGTKLGTGDNLTLVGLSETIPMIGPAGLVVSAELNLNIPEVKATMQSFEPALEELTQNLFIFVYSLLIDPTKEGPDPERKP